MLSLENIEKFNQDGFCIIKNLLTDEVSQYKKDLMSLMFKQVKGDHQDDLKNDFDALVMRVMKPGSRERQFIYDTSRMLGSLKTIQVNSKIINALKQLDIHLPVYIGNPTVRFDLPGSDEFKYLRGPHQDLRGIRCEKCYTVWIPLTECNESCGTVAFYPGTHTKGLLPHDVKPNLEVSPDRLPNNRLVIQASPGDVAIFNSFLVHESVSAKKDLLKCIAFFCVNDGLCIEIDNNFDERRENLPKFGDMLKKEVAQIEDRTYD